MPTSARLAATGCVAITSKNDNIKRVLYLIDGLEGDGAERQFCELVKGIHGLEEYEPHVGVLETNDDGHAWMIEQLGITVNEFSRKSRFDLSPIPAIVRYIRANDIDLVHAFMSMGSEFGLIAGKYCGIPVITSSIRNGKNRDWREAVRTWYQAHFADLAVANSFAGLKSRFRHIRDSFRVIYNGFDLERFAIDPAEQVRLRDGLGLSADVRLLCMAARMEPQKDHMTLLEAMRQVRATHPAAVLLLAGQGSGQQRLEEKCRTLGLEDNVRFLGHRRDAEKIIALCEISILLTDTDVHHEGISNTIIESMALGKPVIATRGGGTDEILADSDAGPPPYEFGIKVDPHDAAQVADAIAYLLDHPSDSARIGAAARKMVIERFNLRRYVDENTTLYRELEQRGKIVRQSLGAG